MMMFMKQTKVWLTLTIVLSLLALASACSKTEPNTNEPTPAAGATAWAPKGNEGTVTGVVSFTGTPPAPKKIDTSSDAACGQKSPNLSTEDSVVTDGKLANVFVYIKEGTLADGKKVTDYTFATPSSAVVLDQDGCHYHPHVLGAMVNQDIEIKNSDPTTHNVNFTPKSNPGWNQSQPAGAPALKHKLARAEVLVPVKCNQHPWMKSYIGVMKHPFFAVSAENGSFTITGVPPGKYTVVAWHEGGAAGTEKTMEVTVPASGSAKADFAFGDAATAGVPSSLPMMPALEFPMVGGH
jgi:plastocyanin